MKSTVNMTVIYAVIALAAFLLMIGYWKLIKEKEKWIQYLYIAVFGINAGYFFLSISDNIQAALAANGIVALLSAFLPFFMLMSIMKVCGFNCSKYLFGALTFAGCLIFLLTASGGCLTLYYREIRLDFINGAAVLIKDHGALHFVYGVYLLLYFAGMIGVILDTMKRKNDISCRIAAFLSTTALCSILVWLLEQLIDVDFELLAVSYVFAGLFLLLLYMILEEGLVSAVGEQTVDETFSEDKMEEQVEEADMSNETISDQIQIRTAGSDLTGIEKLSEREKEVLILIMDNRKRKDIAEELEITENTVKKHTSHIFAKLGVSSRKELFAKCNYVPENKVLK